MIKYISKNETQKQRSKRVPTHYFMYTLHRNKKGIIKFNKTIYGAFPTLYGNVLTKCTKQNLKFIAAV